MSSVTVNIAKKGSNEHDTNYRYKRDIISVTCENTHGGLTVLQNIDVVAKQIKVPSLTLKKYLQKKLGCVITGQKIKGQFSAVDIDKCIQKYIEEHVLCPRCSLPELHKGICNACGNSKSKKDSNVDVIEDVVEKKVDEYEKQLNLFMNKLYDIKDKDKEAQKCLDLCWHINTFDQWNVLKTLFGDLYQKLMT
jgi:translation initiation factor 2 beta subunit (eIF-2beta)/eIF-5